MLVEGYSVIRRRDWRLGAYAVGMFAVCFIAVGALRQQTFNALGYEINERAYRGTSYFLLLGQYNKMTGQWNRHIAYEVGKLDAPRSVRDSVFYTKAWREVAARDGIKGQLSFYGRKLALCWGDIRQDVMPFIREGSLPFALRLALWLFAILCVPLLAFVRHDRMSAMLLLSVAGAVGYLMLLEAASRYTMLFAPVLFTAAGCVCAAAAERERRRSSACD